MKLWHALSFALIILMGAETLVDRNDDVSAIEQAESKIARRVEGGEQARSEPVPETPRVTAANLQSWFSPDGEPAEEDFADSSRQPSQNQQSPEGRANEAGTPNASAVAASAQQSSPGAVLSHAGGKIPAPMEARIERSF